MLPDRWPPDRILAPYFHQHDHLSGHATLVGTDKRQGALARPIQPDHATKALCSEQRHGCGRWRSHGLQMARRLLRVRAAKS